MRKKNDSLRKLILNKTKIIAIEDGVEAINIRLIAKRSNISIGTVYNYFDNKDDILLELTQEYWQDALKDMSDKIKDDLFYININKIFIFLNEKIDDLASVLMNSLENIKPTAKNCMNEMQKSLSQQIISLIDMDYRIKKEIWNEIFTKDKFAEFIIIHIFFSLKQKQKNIDFLIELIKQLLY